MKSLRHSQFWRSSGRYWLLAWGIALHPSFPLAPEAPKKRWAPLTSHLISAAAAAAVATATAAAAAAKAVGAAAAAVAAAAAAVAAEAASDPSDLRCPPGSVPLPALHHSSVPAHNQRVATPHRWHFRLLVWLPSEVCKCMCPHLSVKSYETISSQQRHLYKNQMKHKKTVHLIVF